MITQVLASSYQHPLRISDSADFDGTEEMQRLADLTGSSDGKTGIFSCWIRFDAGAGARSIFIGANGRFDITKADFPSSNRFYVLGKTPAGVTILDINSATETAPGTAWRHILASWDLATTTTHLYINDVSDRTVTTVTNDTIDYTDTNWFIAGNGAVRLDACFADLYFAPNQYLDFSLVANRRKFISQSGKPVHLGATGSLPTGTAPIVFLHLDDGEAAGNWQTNRGTGGNWTQSGTLTIGSSSPSD